MAKDKVVRLEALVSMKTEIINALMQDFLRLRRIIRRKDAELEELRAKLTRLEQKWWKQQDEDTQWLNSQLRSDEDPCMAKPDKHCGFPSCACAEAAALYQARRATHEVPGIEGSVSIELSTRNGDVVDRDNPPIKVG